MGWALQRRWQSLGSTQIEQKVCSGGGHIHFPRMSSCACSAESSTRRNLAHSFAATKAVNPVSQKVEEIAFCLPSTYHPPFMRLQTPIPSHFPHKYHMHPFSQRRASYPRLAQSLGPPLRSSPMRSSASIMTTEFPRITHIPNRTFSLLALDSVASSSTMLRKTCVNGQHLFYAHISGQDEKIHTS